MDSQTDALPKLTMYYGIFLIGSGWLATSNPGSRKLWMHVAVSFGLLCALGGTRFFMVMDEGLTYATGSMLMLLLTGSAYTFLCVRSFIEARRASE